MWTQKLIETERGTFEYFEKGEGEPLAVTHLYSEYDQRGNTFATPFTNYYKVHLINLRGAGNSISATSEEQYSMAQSVLDLEAIRAALKLEKWSFAGHSAGGMLALKYVVMFPESLIKIIAGGAAASFEYAKDPGSIYCSKNPNFTRIIELMESLNNSGTSVEERRKLGYEWSLMSYVSEEKLQESLKIPNSGKTVGPRLDYFRKIEYPTYDVREQLNAVSKPCFIYAGRFDAQCPMKYGKEIASLIRNSQFTLFEQSNHNPFSEEQDKFDEFVLGTTKETVLQAN
ncbi:alpha/beta fold hydrolase [Ureibacillus sp. GCM10028918]|uniref:alpha/beta fold hydrolase n=1 Tax=Ureibacillus sp. GCM10028918 TaxID=3273429 RepID=UPI003623C0B2